MSTAGRPASRADCAARALSIDSSIDSRNYPALIRVDSRMRLTITRGSFLDRLLLAAGPPERAQLRAIQDINADIQSYITHHGAEVPAGLLHLLSSLDFAASGGTGINGH